MRIFLSAFTQGLIVLFFIFQLTPSVFAHGGVQKRNSNYIVTLYQSPISPLVGERVMITFVVTDHNLNPVRDQEGTLVLIDTFYGDESKDKKMLERKFQTDANGAFEFEYSFNKENYFNLELIFKGKEDKADHIDFLIEPREAGTIITKFQNLRTPEIMLFIGLGITLGIFGVKLFKVKK